MTFISVPILTGSGSGTVDAPIQIVAEAAPEQTEATTLLHDADTEALFEAGAQEDDLPLSASMGAVGNEMNEWPGQVAGRAVGTLSKDQDTAGEEPDPSEADATVASEASPARTVATSPPATNPPATRPPTTSPPSTKAPEPKPTPPTTSAPETKPPTNAETTQSEPAAAGEPTAAQWAALRRCESHDDYTKVSGNGLYFGAYQFGVRTWDDLARAVGRSDLVGVLPSKAPAADQDQMALELWRRRGWTPWPTCGAAAVNAA